MLCVNTYALANEWASAHASVCAEHQCFLFYLSSPLSSFSPLLFKNHGFSYHFSLLFCIINHEHRNTHLLFLSHTHSHSLTLTRIHISLSAPLCCLPYKCDARFSIFSQSVCPLFWIHRVYERMKRLYQHVSKGNFNVILVLSVNTFRKHLGNISESNPIPYTTCIQIWI